MGSIEDAGDSIPVVFSVAWEYMEIMVEIEIYTPRDTSGKGLPALCPYRFIMNKRL